MAFFCYFEKPKPVFGTDGAVFICQGYTGCRRIDITDNGTIVFSLCGFNQRYLGFASANDHNCFHGCGAPDVWNWLLPIITAPAERTIKVVRRIEYVEKQLVANACKNTEQLGIAGVRRVLQSLAPVSSGKLLHFIEGRFCVSFFFGRAGCKPPPCTTDGRNTVSKGTLIV